MLLENELQASVFMCSSFEVSLYLFAHTIIMCPPFILDLCFYYTSTAFCACSLTGCFLIIMLIKTH